MSLNKARYSYFFVMSISKEMRLFSKVSWSGRGKLKCVSVLLPSKKEVLVIQLSYMEPSSTETSFPRGMALHIPFLPAAKPTGLVEADFLSSNKRSEA